MTTTYLDQLEVERVTHTNDDLTIVNAARVSNAKRVDDLVTSESSEEDQVTRVECGMGLDDRMIQYLADNNHWTPFAHARYGFACVLPDDYDWSAFLNWSGNERLSSGFSWRCHSHEEGVVLQVHGSLFGWVRHFPPIGRDVINKIHNHLIRNAPISFSALDMGDGLIRPELSDKELVVLPNDSVTFRIIAPIFVLRQLMRSNVGVVYNETSRRYVDGLPEFYVPAAWRGRPDKSIKQGSGKPLGGMLSARIDERMTLHNDLSIGLYGDLLDMGVAPEMARIPLPVSMLSEVWMTVTHDALQRVMNLRLGADGKNHPQAEIVALAKAMEAELPKGFWEGI